MKQNLDFKEDVTRDSKFQKADIVRLSNSLYPLSEDKKADIWSVSTGKLFLGLMLWMLDTEAVTRKTPTLPYLLSLVGVEGGLGAWMKREVAQHYLSDDCVREFNTFLTFPEKTQHSIIACLVPPLESFNCCMQTVNIDLTGLKSLSSEEVELIAANRYKGG